MSFATVKHRGACMNSHVQHVFPTLRIQVNSHFKMAGIAEKTQDTIIDSQQKPGKYKDFLIRQI